MMYATITAQPNIRFNPSPTSHDAVAPFILGNDGHVSELSWNWLARNCSNDLAENFRREVEPTLWDSTTHPTDAESSVDFDAYLSSSDGVRDALVRLIKFGFVNVVNCPPTMDGTKIVSERSTLNIYGLERCRQPTTIMNRK